jgi:quinol monooxygenase YgiN
MPVRMIVCWLTPIGQAHRITMALHSMMDDTRALHGCVGCSVSTRIRDQGVVRYVEEWQTEEDLRRRVGSSAFTGLAAANLAAPAGFIGVGSYYPGRGGLRAGGVRAECLPG